MSNIPTTCYTAVRVTQLYQSPTTVNNFAIYVHNRLAELAKTTYVYATV